MPVPSAGTGIAAVERMSNRKALFTIEVGLGVMLLALILVPVLGVLHRGVKGTAESLQVLRALQAARSALDAAESLGYSRLTDQTLQALIARVDVPGGVSRPRADALEVAQRASGDGTWYRAKVITVRVSWTRFEGREEHGEVVVRGLAILTH